MYTSFEPRRKGSGESDTAVAAQPSATGSPNTSSSSQQISSASITSSIPTSSSSSGSGASSGSSNNSSSINTSSTSSSPVPSASSVTRTIIRSDITTAGIVGIAVGSGIVTKAHSLSFYLIVFKRQVAVLVLAYMLFTKCIRRNRRRTQGRDQRPGTGFLRMGSSSPVRPQTPVTEMSQTQSSPLISSAVVAGATISPHLSQYSMSNTPATLSPLIFPAQSPSLHHTHSLASTSDKSAANTHISGGVHTEISSHDALSYMSSLRGNILGSGNGILPVISRNVSVSNSSSSSEPPASPVSQQSELHHAMAMYQKSLENDPKGLDVGRLHTDSEDVNDPPPSYDA